MPFTTGKSGNPGGRPKNRRWAKVEWWFNELTNDLKDDRLKIRDKVYIELECIKLLLGKAAPKSKSPEDSASNAKDALKLLKALEGKKHGVNATASIDSDKSSVDDRGSDIQAVNDPKIDEGGLGSEQK